MRFDSLDEWLDSLAESEEFDRLEQLQDRIAVLLNKRRDHRDLANNVLLVAQGNDHPALFKSHLYTQEIYWVSGVAPQLPLRCMAKVRYRQKDQPCALSHSPEQGYRVDFDSPQRAITPGQSVVFYQHDLCLGGGVIEQTGR